MKSKIKILHLEDTLFDAEMIARELKKANILFDIEVVENKKDFEKALSGTLPDIILSDHSLPSFDSAGAIAIAKKKAPSVPFILVTSTVSEEFAVEILQQGASDYILKNNLKRLPSAVKKSIEQSRLSKEKQIADEELERSYLQVRKLAAHLQDVREEERAAMAREIHDELGQNLTALKLDVTWLGIKLKDAGPVVAEKLQDMDAMVTASLKTVKKLASGFHPAMLEKLGLAAAIEWQAAEFEKRTGIHIDLDLPNSLEGISIKTNIALFRIFQESFTNIARHSGATNVVCSIKKNEEHIRLTVTDNGKGFDMKMAEQNHSLGLLGMKERSVMLGGKYDITSGIGKGTTVCAELPVTEIPF